jgi:HSP20 family protein
MSNLFPVSRLGYNPFSITPGLEHLVDSFFNHAPVQRAAQPSHDALALVPRANVLKNANGFVIELAAPGLSRDDFELGVKNSTLSVIVGTEDTKEYTSSLTMQEYSYASFSRSWTLPSDINIAGINARYEAGILTIDVPTQERAADSVIIDIK